MATRKTVEVAAAVIERADGMFLLGRRPPGTVYAGWWEFPGGKLEAGESAEQALTRELQEELGMRVLRSRPWLTREFAYEHAHVRLHFFRVTAWQGEIRALLHDALAWQSARTPDVGPMLPANAPILKALQLPDYYGISHAGVIGIRDQLELVRSALARGLRLLQIREPDLSAPDREQFAHEVIALARGHEALVLVNGDAELAHKVSADGLHLKAGQLAECARRPDFAWVAASCHNAAELAKAERLGCDLAVLGPVAATATHPGQASMGWPRFDSLCRGRSIPIFAIGGMQRADVASAQSCGAHGIAAIHDAWHT